MSGWVLVTGSAQRIGRAIALDLAARGWDIIVHYNHSADAARQTAEEIQKLGASVCLAEIDLSNAQKTENLIPSLAEEIGMIDALVNNASLFEPDESDPDGSRHWAINADAPRILSKAFRDHLPPNEKGVIVNLLDGITAPPHFSSYAKSKEQLANLTRNMARSFAPQVRVNGVVPLYTMPSKRQSEQDFLKMAAGRITTPEQIASAVRQMIESPGETGRIVTFAL